MILYLGFTYNCQLCSARIFFHSYLCIMIIVRVGEIFDSDICPEMGRYLHLKEDNLGFSKESRSFS